MIPDPRCPACEAEDAWEVVGTTSFARTAAEDQDEYTSRRLRVLFELWAPGESVVRLEWAMCTRCGFLTYLPRPTAQDIDAKYAFLARQQAGEPRPADDVRNARERGRLIQRFLRPYLRTPHRRLLDFGGGDGSLMLPFVDSGISCHVLDYAERAVPGVERVGATLADLEEDDVYDIVVASHVVEHLAEPLDVLRRLAAHLSGHGLLYVEVPMEIWRAPPRLDEPVTHVSFFTWDSLSVLLEQAGLAVLRSRLGGLPHPSGRRVQVIRAVASASAPARRTVPGRSVSTTRSVLDPGLADRIGMAFRDPTRSMDALLRKLGVRGP